MIISSPNYCWCCHTLQHTAFPTGTSHLPGPNFCSTTTCLESENPPKRELDFDHTVVIWLLEEYKQSWGWHLPEHKFLLPLLLSAPKSMATTPEAGQQCSWRTYSPQPHKPQNRYCNITWVPRWRKFPVATMVARKGKTKTSPPQWSQQPLSVVVISLLTILYLPCFISSMNSVAEHCKSITFIRDLSF